MVPLKLPLSVVNSIDVARLMRELNGLNDFFVAAKARATGTAMQLPKLSRMMDQLAHENKINLLEADERTKLLESLEKLSQAAPNFHISFAVEPSPRAVDKIVLWLRQNIDPQTLLSVGLQPSIAAGCVLRTTNRIFDMSLRSRLNTQTEYLLQLIKGAANG